MNGIENVGWLKYNIQKTSHIILYVFFFLMSNRKSEKWEKTMEIVFMSVNWMGKMFFCVPVLCSTYHVKWWSSFRFSWMKNGGETTIFFGIWCEHLKREKKLWLNEFLVSSHVILSNLLNSSDFISEFSALSSNASCSFYTKSHNIWINYDNTSSKRSTTKSFIPSF